MLYYQCLPLTRRQNLKFELKRQRGFHNWSFVFLATLGGVDGFQVSISSLEKIYLNLHFSFSTLLLFKGYKSHSVEAAVVLDIRHLTTSATNLRVNYSNFKQLLSSTFNTYSYQPSCKPKILNPRNSEKRIWWITKKKKIPLRWPNCQRTAKTLPSRLIHFLFIPKSKLVSPSFLQFFFPYLRHCRLFHLFRCPFFCCQDLTFMIIILDVSYVVLIFFLIICFLSLMYSSCYP